MSRSFLAAAAIRAADAALLRTLPQTPVLKSPGTSALERLQQRKAAASAATPRRYSTRRDGGDSDGPPSSRRVHRPPALEVVTPEQLLGEGASGKVVLGRFGHDGQEVAAKVIGKAALDPEDGLAWVREEIAIHTRMRHPHVCTLHCVVEDHASFTLVLELCRGGTLADTLGRKLRAGGALGEARSQAAFAQLVGALDYLARHGVCHRDIKLENLGWATPEETRLLLLDFGHASTRDRHASFAGSAHFAAPEVHRCYPESNLESAGGNESEPSAPPYSAALADVWSCGVCLFAMIATRLPFGGSEDTAADRGALRSKVLSGVWDVRPPCSAAACGLLEAMLSVAAAERITLIEILEHEWMPAVPWEGHDDGEWAEVPLLD